MLRQTLVVLVLVLLAAAETRVLKKRGVPYSCYSCLEGSSPNCISVNANTYRMECSGHCAVAIDKYEGNVWRACASQFTFDTPDGGPPSDNGCWTDMVNEPVCVCRHSLCNNASIAQIGINECDSSPCQNGATCIDDVLSFGCTCPAGWTGDVCGINIFCASNPCQHGNCSGLGNGYNCTCAPGWTGANCNVNINECSSAPCKYGATCKDLVNGFNCTCASGWAGTICTININECASSPCKNGATCVDMIDRYNCFCAVGYNGTNCTTGSGPCNSSPCGTNGICNLTTSGNYICQCYNGFTGIQCETNVNECASSPCAAPKLCKDMVNAYDCACPAGFDGANCSHRYYNCTGVPLLAADPVYCDRYFTCLAGSKVATNDKCRKVLIFQLIFDTISRTCQFNSTATRMPNCTLSDPVSIP